MLTEQQLNDLIEAWPDENGVSKNPETYEAWKQTEKAIFYGLLCKLWVENE